MPISPISQGDLINIVRAGILFNAADTGVDFNININGSEVDNTATGSISPPSQWGVGSGTSSAYSVTGDIDWTSLILPIPDGAVITNILLQTRFSCQLRGFINFSRNSGGAVVNGLASGDIADASINVPNTILVPSTDTTIVESEIDALNDVFEGNLVATLFIGSQFISKIWDVAALGNGITKAQLEAQFTELFISIAAAGGASITNLVGPGTYSFTADAEATSQVATSIFVGRITWDYIYQWTINPPELSGVLEGDIITITSEGVNALLLNELTITMGGIPVVPIIQDPNIITFPVPPGIPDGPTPIISTGNGTQFSGSLPLGVLEIIGADVSGIYVLDIGKTNDTLYSSSRDGSVTERAIPNPYIESGFIGG